jgi:hypothetical protein
MDEWRVRLRTVVDLWGLSPEDASAIADELEQHLEDEFAELRSRLGDAKALEQLLKQVNDPALRTVAVRPRHDAPMTVIASRASGHGWTGLMRDVRYGWRGLGRSPGTTAMAVIALALGIGLTTVMFSIIYGTLLRGLPFQEGGRIAAVMEANPSRSVDQQDLSMHDFFAYRQGQKSFETFGAYLPMQTINISGDDRPERLDAARVTAEALTIDSSATGARSALSRRR